MLPHIEVVTTDPAASGELSWTAPEDCIVHGARFQFVTSATAGNRRVRLAADGGADAEEYYRMATASDQAATTTHEYCGFPGAPASVVQALTQLITLPNGGLKMRKGDRLKTVTLGLVAGDNFGPATLLIERI